MSDVEWYVESGGNRSGPFSARDIVQMHSSGQLPGNAMATAARMNGDWVTVADLVEAFRELNHVAKPASTPARPVMPTAVGDGPSFQPPPRPTKQLEESKIINLAALRAQENAPSDATDSLFLAIQSIREKAQTKTAQAAPAKDNWGELRRPAQGLTPQTKLYGALAGIVVIVAYGVVQLSSDEPAPAPASAPPAVSATRPSAESTATRPTSPGSGGSKLLDSSGSGAARTVPPVRLQPGGGAVRIGDDERAAPDRRRGGGGMRAGMPVRPAENPEEIDQTEPEYSDYDQEGQNPPPGTGMVNPANPNLMGGMNPDGAEGGEGAYPIDHNAQFAEPLDGGVAPDSGSP